MKKAILFPLVILLWTLLSHTAVWAGGGEAYPDLKTNKEALSHWQSLKFGMFIHWGPVSLRGTEIGWSRGREIPIEEYDNLYREFNPVLFDAREWVATAKAAGMKYIVITSKHHDGFCIWDSEFTDYDIMASPFKRDILRELADECKRQGILFGTYHSIADWHHPDYTTRYGGDPRPVSESDMSRYVVYLKNQVRELIEKYDTNILWFDGEWEDAWTHELGMDLYAYARGLKDNILINNRVDKGRRGMQGMTASEKFAGDFGTPEQEIGSFFPDKPWESCITICRQWAWKPNDQLKSLQECIHTLARTAGGGGNLLLNVGPMLDGRIEQRQIDRLRQVGTWLERNGESIYGTTAGPFKPTGWSVSTHKGNRNYLHLFHRPEKEMLLPDLGERQIQKARILGGEPLSIRHSGDSVFVVLPDRLPDANDTVVVLELDGDAGSISPLEMPDQPIHGFVGALKFRFPFSEKYPSSGSNSLVDGIRGSLSYSDGNWLGFEQVDLEVRLDLGAEKNVKTVTAGFLQNQNSWIFFPTALEVLVSRDGTDFRPASKVELGEPVADSAIKTRQVTVQVDEPDVRFLEIRAKNVGQCPGWHKGAGRKAWLFVDEITVD